MLFSVLTTPPVALAERYTRALMRMEPATATAAEARLHFRPGPCPSFLLKSRKRIYARGTREM